MDIRAIAIDLDHTLLNSQFEISEENAKAIKEASAKGIYLIIATGRMPSALNKYLKKIASHIDCMIYCNGAITMDAKTSELISSQVVPLDACVKLISKFDSDRYNVVFFSGNRVLSRNVIRDPLLEHHVKRTGETIELCFDKKIPTQIPIHKFFIYDLAINKNYDDSVESFFETAVYNDILQFQKVDLRATKTRLGYVECTHKNVSKFTSIDTALSKKGMSRKHLMAIGDSYNDIDMVKNAMLGVAVGNAIEEIKKVSKIVVSDNDHAGVAEAIYKITSTK